MSARTPDEALEVLASILREPACALMLLTCDRDALERLTGPDFLAECGLVVGEAELVLG